MDLETLNILNRINFHLKIKKYLVSISYFFIASGILIFIFYAISTKNKKYKIISEYQNNPHKFQSEKIMINPQIRFQYNEQDVYEINAKKAIHFNNEEVTLYDVFAEGKIGNITAGELKIDESGDHLVFSKNPILILNNKK